MSRQQSIFKSTKAVAQSTANIITEGTSIIVDELQATRRLNNVENNIEVTEAKINGLRELNALETEGIDAEDLALIMKGVKETIISA